jgi:hypothetical protein
VNPLSVTEGTTTSAVIASLAFHMHAHGCYDALCPKWIPLRTDTSHDRYSKYHLSKWVAGTLMGRDVGRRIRPTR